VNPDAYDKRRVNKVTRSKTVADIVKEILEGTYEKNAYSKMYFCYYHSKSDHLIEAHKQHWDCEIID
jgi:hypothetical protein